MTFAEEASMTGSQRPPGSGSWERAQRMPPEFRETILTGWWTTCLEILPTKERARGKY